MFPSQIPDLRMSLPFSESLYYECFVLFFVFFEWHHTLSELFPNLLKLNIAPPGLGTIRCYVF